MKIINTTFCIIFIAFASVLAQKPYTITGKFSNTPATSKVYLFEYFGSNFVLVDSTIAKNGTFLLNPKANYPRGFYQIGENTQNSAILILANENITISGDWKDLKSTIAIPNSKENDYFKKLLVSNANIQSLSKKAEEMAPMQNTNPTLFKIEMYKLQKNYDSVNTSQIKMKSEVINQQTNLYFSKVLKMFEMPENIEKSKFFTEDELSNSEYARGDMLNNKIAFYMQKFGGKVEETYKLEAENMVVQFKEKSKNRELAYIVSLSLQMQSGMSASKKLAKNLQLEYPNSKFAKDLVAQMPKGEPQIGDLASEIMLKDANDEVFKLSSLKGKYVLIDFWASWCGPCRQENPNVVNVYNRYKDKGFTILSVSLDNSKERWLGAIQQDGLTWPNHVSDLKGWQSEAAALYAVRGIPATFLIDKEGIIIAKNLRGAALEDKLAELLH